MKGILKLNEKNRYQHLAGKNRYQHLAVKMIGKSLRRATIKMLRGEMHTLEANEAIRSLSNVKEKTSAKKYKGSGKL